MTFVGRANIALGKICNKLMRLSMIIYSILILLPVGPCVLWQHLVIWITYTIVYPSLLSSISFTWFLYFCRLVSAFVKQRPNFRTGSWHCFPPVKTCTHIFLLIFFSGHTLVWVYPELSKTKQSKHSLWTKIWIFLWSLTLKIKI